MAHGCLTEASDSSLELCPPGKTNCVACGRRPFDGSYGCASCEAHHGSVLEHRSGEAADKLTAVRERHVYTVA